MNIKLPLLVLSILGNVILVFALARSPALPVPPPPATSAAASTPSATPRTVASAVTQTVTNTVTKKFGWESVESANYSEYIANLRAIGCPEETIRDIIVADVNKLYEQKRKALPGAQTKFEYWKPGFAWASAQPDDLDKLNALNKEKNELLRALGIEPDVKTAVAAMVHPFERMLDFLPEKKKGQLVELMMDMQARMAKQMKDNSRPDPEEMAKAQKEMEDAITRMLTPEEKLDYDLRMSMTANMMRNQIGGFDPSQEEFLTVFKLRKTFDDEFSPMLAGQNDKAARDKRNEAQKQLDEKIKAALGDTRYEDYKVAQDHNFQNIYRAAKSADLGASEARKVYEMKKLAEESANKIRSDKSLNTEDRTAALKNIRSETEQAIQKVLGEKGWKNYGRGYGTSWLENINRQQPPPKATSR